MNANPDHSQSPIVVHLDPEIEQLIPDFLANRRTDVDVLQEAAETRDFDTIQRLGHSLKGVGGGFGFDRISDIGGAIEIAAREQRVDGVRDGVRALRSYLDRIRVVFDGEG